MQSPAAYHVRMGGLGPNPWRLHDWSHRRHQGRMTAVTSRDPRLLKPPKRAPHRCRGIAGQHHQASECGA
jgi:hypothetical protein